MKRHITEAWKRHTNSSTLILPGAEKRQAENTAARPPPAQPFLPPHQGWWPRSPHVADAIPPATISAFCHPEPRAATFLQPSGSDLLILSALGQEWMSRIISTSTAQNTTWHSQDMMSQDDLKGGREVRKTLKSSGVPTLLGFKKLGNDHAQKILNLTHSCCKVRTAPRLDRLQSTKNPSHPLLLTLTGSKTWPCRRENAFSLTYIHINALTGTGKACKQFSKIDLHFITSLD